MCVDKIKKCHYLSLMRGKMSNKKKPIFKFAISNNLQDTGDLFLPKLGTPQSSGWDVRAAYEDRCVHIYKYGEYGKIPLGLRAYCPDGWWFEVKPRSSSFIKKNLHPLYGTIDNDYYGDLYFVCQYLPEDKDSCIKIAFGEAIGQIIPIERKIMEVQNISNEEYDSLCKYRKSERGPNGFGSTGK